MKKLLYLITTLLIPYWATGQITGKLSGDTTKMTSTTKNTVFVIENATKNINGYLYNYNGGRTMFKIPSIADISSLSDSLLKKLNNTTTITIDGVTKNLVDNPAFSTGGGGGEGTVTDISIVTANGISGTVATSTTTPAITLSLDSGKWTTRNYFATHPYTFPNDITVRGTTVGKYTNGQTIPSAGKTPYEVWLDVATATIHPTYNIPTATISGSPAPGGYEVGTNLNVTLNSTFTQNQGGALNSTTYKRGATTVTSPDAITVTSSISYTVQKAYDTGVCINNNLGVLDCIVGSGNAPNPAPVASGTATSSSITYFPTYKRYWGRCVGTTPTNSEILAAAGGSTDVITNHAFNISNITASGSNHVFLAALASYGHITSLTQNGFPSFSAYTEVTASVTNVNGQVNSYYILVSNNLLTADSGVITTN